MGIRGWVVVLVMLAGCRSQPLGPDSVLARFDSGEVTVADLERHLLGLGNPEPPRAPDQAMTWWQRHLADAFQAKVLVSEEELLFLKTDANFQKQTHARTAEALAARYLANVQPSFLLTDEEVAIQQTGTTTPVERRAIANIFLKFPEGADAAAREAIEAKAREIHAQIQDQASFEGLAKSHSDSATAGAGGISEPIAKEALHPALAEAVFQTQAGKWTEVLVNEDGCHLVFVVAIYPLGFPPKTLAAAKSQALQDMQRQWAEIHLTERLIELNLPLSAWPDAPADANGVLFTLDEETVTVPDVTALSSGRVAAREVFLKLVSDRVFAHFFRQQEPELADAIANAILYQQAFRAIRKEILMAEVMALPDQELHQHYLAYPERFQTREQMALAWYRFATATGEAKAKKFAAELEAGSPPSIQPDQAQKTPVVPLPKLREMVPNLWQHLPEEKVLGQVVGPVVAVDGWIVMQITNYQPAQVVPYANLHTQVHSDYLRTHAARLNDAWAQTTQTQRNYREDTKALRRYALQASAPPDAGS